MKELENVLNELKNELENTSDFEKKIEILEEIGKKSKQLKALKIKEVILENPSKATELLEVTGVRAVIDEDKKVDVTIIVDVKKED